VKFMKALLMDALDSADALSFYASFWPEYLKANPVIGDVRENCWSPATRGRLRELLNVGGDYATTVPWL
jgi:hypothetical protein